MSLYATVRGSAAHTRGLLIYIGYIVIPPEVGDKIRRKHRLTEDEVREAIQFPARARAQWEDHPEHGLRVIASGTSWTERPILAWLEPIDELDGTWRLRSARARPEP